MVIRQQSVQRIEVSFQSEDKSHRYIHFVWEALKPFRKKNVWRIFAGVGTYLRNPAVCVSLFATYNVNSISHFLELRAQL